MLDDYEEPYESAQPVLWMGDPVRLVKEIWKPLAGLLEATAGESLNQLRLGSRSRLVDEGSMPASRTDEKVHAVRF